MSELTNQDYTSISQLINIPVDDIKSTSSLCHQNPRLSDIFSKLSFFATNYFEELSKKRLVDSQNELRFNQLEQKLHLSNSKIKELEQKSREENLVREELKHSLKSNVETIKELKGNLEVLHAKNRTEEENSINLNKELKAVIAKNSTLEIKLKEKTDLFKEGMSELDEERNTAKDLNSKILELQEKNHQLMLETNSLNFKVDSQKQESSYYKSKYETSNKKYNELETEYNKIKTDLSIQINNLTNINRTLKVENENLIRELETKKEQLKERKERVESLINKESELKRKLIDQETAFKCEIESKSKLCTLWESGLKEARSRLETLEKLIDQKQVELESCKKEHDILKNKALQKYAKFEENIEKMEIQIASMHNIDSNNVSNSNSITNINGGRSFTQTYTELIALKADNSIKQKQILKLTKFLDGLLIDIEDKVSVLFEKENLFKAVAKQTTFLSKKTRQLQTENEETLKKNKLLLQESAKIKEKNTILNKTISDLSIQIRRLICEIEGTEYVESMQSNTSSIISEELKPFKSINELQEQNQILISTIHELTSELDKAQLETSLKAQSTKDSKTESFENKILTLESTIVAEKARSKSLETRCDMYERIINQSNGTYIKENNDNESNLELKKKLDEIVSLKSEYEQYKLETEKNINMYNEEIKLIQKNYYESKLQLSTKESSYEHLKENYDILCNNYNQASEELKTYQKYYHELELSLNNQDQAFQQNLTELSTSKQKIDFLNSELNSFKTQNQILKNNNEKLTKESDELRNDKSRLSEIINSMNLIHSAYDKESKAARDVIEKRLKESESARKSLVDNLDRLSKESEEKNSEKEQHITKIMMKLDIMNKDLLQRSEERKILQQRLTSSESKIKELEEVANTLKKQLEKHESAQIITELIQTRKDLSKNYPESSSADNKELLAQIEQFKLIANTSESSLKSLSDTYSQYKSKKDAEIKRINEKLVSQTLKLEKLTAENDNIQKQLAENSFKYNKELNDAKQDMISSRNIADKHVKNIQELNDHNSVLKKELAETQKRLEQSNEKFEKELTYHSDTVKKLSHLKKEHIVLKQKLQFYESSSNLETQTKNNNVKELNSKILFLETEVENLKKKNHDLSTQNSITYKHLELVTNKALKLNLFHLHTHSPIDAHLSSTTHNENDREADLLIVLKHLRDENHLLTCQLEVSSKETQRLRVQLSGLEREIQNVNLSLEKERKVYSQYESLNMNNQELMEKLENLNVLRESNTLLRAEKNKYLNKTNELERLNKELNAQLQPLKNSINKLTCEIKSINEIKSSLEEDNIRWKQRTQQILQKYDRIDPVEHEKLKEELKLLRERVEASQKRVSDTEKEIGDKRRIDTQEIEKLSKESTMWRTRAERSMTTLREQIRINQENKTQIDKLLKSSADSRNLKNDLSQLTEKIRVLEAKANTDELEIKNSKAELEASNDKFVKLKKYTQELFAKHAAIKKELNKHLEKNIDSPKILAANPENTESNENDLKGIKNSTETPKASQPENTSSNVADNNKAKANLDSSLEKNCTDIIVIQSPEEREKRKNNNDVTHNSDNINSVEGNVVSPQKRPKPSEDSNEKTTKDDKTSADDSINIEEQQNKAQSEKEISEPNNNKEQNQPATQ